MSKIKYYLKLKSRQLAPNVVIVYMYSVLWILLSINVGLYIANPSQFDAWVLSTSRYSWIVLVSFLSFYGFIALLVVGLFLLFLEWVWTSIRDAVLRAKNSIVDDYKSTIENNFSDYERETLLDDLKSGNNAPIKKKRL